MLTVLVPGVGMGATEGEPEPPGDPSDGSLPLVGVGR